MKLRSLLSMPMAAATLLTSGMPSNAGFSSPLIALYRVNGVKDNGGADNTGVATAFLCTNWSALDEGIQIFVKSQSGSIVTGSPKVAVGAGSTLFAATHGTVMFSELLVGGGTFIEGSALILGTSPQISCTAMMLDASAAVPNGIALHMVRFNAPTGSQE